MPYAPNGSNRNKPLKVNDIAYMKESIYGIK
jgi:hypothetical protein